MGNVAWFNDDRVGHLLLYYERRSVICSRTFQTLQHPRHGVQPEVMRARTHDEIVTECSHQL